MAPAHATSCALPRGLAPSLPRMGRPRLGRPCLLPRMGRPRLLGRLLRLPRHRALLPQPPVPLPRQGFLLSPRLPRQGLQPHRLPGQHRQADLLPCLPRRQHLLPRLHLWLPPRLLVLSELAPNFRITSVSRRCVLMVRFGTTRTGARSVQQALPLLFLLHIGRLLLTRLGVLPWMKNFALSNTRKLGPLFHVLLAQTL